MKICTVSPLTMASHLLWHVDVVAHLALPTLFDFPFKRPVTMAPILAEIDPSMSYSATFMTLLALDAKQFCKFPYTVFIALVNSTNSLVQIQTKILKFRKSARSQSGQKVTKSQN